MMKLEGGRQGNLRLNLPGKAEYYSFNPSPLDSVVPLHLDDAQIADLARCSRKIGEVEGMSHFVPNADMYLAMYVRKEALLSSQIEGTQCTFDDMLDPSNSTAYKREVIDVVNYVSAAELAVREMDRLPLCMKLLREVHAELLKDARGSDKHLGEIRTSQNWIGPHGCTIRQAAFVPPNVDDMNDALFRLENFMNREDLDPVVKAALVHYQFETIHPFLDGNGRLGRLLITLSLINDGVLTKPVFYPSYQLKLRRSEYYERLTAVRERGAYEEWVSFFCECMSESAADAAASLKSLVELHNRSEKLIREHLARAATNGLSLLEFLEAHPIVTTASVRDGLGVSRTTASNLIEDYRKIGILRVGDEDRQRYRQYVYEDYLSILRAGVDPL